MHTHTWHLVADLVLMLPDISGWYDRLLSWRCRCGEYSLITGSFHVTAAPVTLPGLEAMAAQERQQGTPLARVAVRQERRRRR